MKGKSKQQIIEMELKVNMNINRAWRILLWIGNIGATIVLLVPTNFNFKLEARQFQV